MKHLLNRIQVYSLYFFEYLKYGEFSSAINAILYMFTRKSYSGEKRIKTSMGIFDTRKGTLDFQYINYAYEIEIKHFIEKQQFDVFFDIGACLGEYSIWLGKKGYKCFAFEPVYDSYYMIAKNILLNQVDDKVKAFNYGLGSKHSVENFQINTINPGASKRVDQANALTQKFEINALNDIYESFHLPKESRILVKIDVEGMEVEMIKGASAFFNYFDNITLIIEEKLTGESSIRNSLSAICDFEFGIVDNFNIYAKKVIKHKL